MKPGLRKNVPADDYHAIPALSASVLKTLRTYCPAQVKHEELFPSEPTDAMNFGTLLHTALLEGDKFDDLYAVAPDCKRQGAKNLETWAAFEAENAGRIRVKQAVVDKVLAMRDAAYANRFVCSLLTAPGGINEGSVEWLHPRLEIPCKLRFDRLVQIGGQALVIDLKSAQDASPRGFEKAIANQGYHVAAAWYLEGLYAVAPAQRTFIWIAQDKDAPYLCAVYQPSLLMLEQGRREAERLANVYAHCMKTGEWHGYTPNGVAEVLELPRWARDRPDFADESHYNADDGKSMEINW